MVSKSAVSSGSAFDIDAGTGIVFSRFFGAITPAEVLSHLLAVGSDARYRREMPTLADLRDARVGWTLQEIVEFRIMLFDTFENRLGGRWALLTTPQGAAGVSKLMENLFLRVDTRLFHTREAALGWLKDLSHAGTAADYPRAEDALRGATREGLY